MTVSKQTHWAMEYLGKPWESGAQGPHAYDCFAMVRAVQRDIFSRELPLIVVDALNTQIVQSAFLQAEHYVQWRQVDAPEEGDCVITKSSPNKPEHVGVWVDVDGGRILQAVFGSGVVLVSPRATRKLIGQHIEYWRYAGC